MGSQLTSRRAFQRAFVTGVVTCKPWERNEAWLLEHYLPSVHNIYIKSAHRSTAENWIEELFERGILIKDGADLESIALHPSRSSEAAALQAIDRLGRPTDLSGVGRFFLIAGLISFFSSFYVFYSYFMPQEVVIRVAGTATVISAILGTGAVALRETPSIRAAFWDRRTLITVWILSAAIAGLDLLGYFTPFRVETIPGATITVDGQHYAVADRDNPAGGAERFQKPLSRWYRLWLPWGDHTIKVSKLWFHDEKSMSKESTAFVTWKPWALRDVLDASKRDAQTNLVTRIHFKLSETLDVSRLTSASTPGIAELDRIVRMEVELFGKYAEHTHTAGRLIAVRGPTGVTVSCSAATGIDDEVFLVAVMSDHKGEATVPFRAIRIDSDGTSKLREAATTELKRAVLEQLGIDPSFDVGNWKEAFANANAVLEKRERIAQAREAKARMALQPLIRMPIEGGNKHPITGARSEIPGAKSESDSIPAKSSDTTDGDDGTKVRGWPIEEEILLAELQPAFAERVRKVLAKARSEGLNIVIAEGQRTMQRQLYLYGSGRPHFKPYGRPGPVVTWMRSPVNHGRGIAVDLGFVKNGRLSLDAPAETWKRIRDIGAEFGLVNPAFQRGDVSHLELGEDAK